MPRQWRALGRSAPAGRPFSSRLLALLIVVVAGCVVALPPSAALAAPSAALGSIRGTVVAESGGVLPGAVINASAVKNGEAPATVVTDATGSFEIDNVVPGNYLISARRTGLPTTYLGNVAFSDFATVVVLGAGQVVSGLTITVPDAGAITGTVSYTGDLSAENRLARVIAYPYDSTTGVLGQWTQQARAGVSGDYSIGSLFPGEYVIRAEDWQSKGRVTPSYWEDAAFWQDSSLVTVSSGTTTAGIDLTVGSTAPGVLRLAGLDRFETAVAISQFGFDDGSEPVVYIVNGLDYPDALSAGPAATVEGGIVLLVTPTQVPRVVRDEIARLAPRTFVVVGGTASVSAAVFDQLNEIAPAVRVGGADRYATSRAVASYAFGDGAYGVYLASGGSFPDALSAGPPAGYGAAPVVLVNNGQVAPTTVLGHLDSATSELLTELGTTSVTIVGGLGVVNSLIESDLETMPDLLEVTRVAGADRYATSRAAGAWARANDVVVLATGATFPDALAGSWLAAGLGAPIYLVPRECIPEDTVAELTLHGVKSIILLGGPGSLSAAVESLTVCAT